MSHACLHRHSITTHNNREDNLVSQSQQQSVGARIHKVGHWCVREINKKKEERRKKSLPDPKKRTSNSNNIDSVYAEHIITNSISL